MKSRSELLDWIERPARNGRSLHVAEAGQSWRHHGYEQLARLASAMAHGLVRAGIGHDDIVAIVSGPGAQLVAALFGTMLCGGIPCMVAPPRVFAQHYDEHLSQIAKQAAPRAILVSTEFAPTLRQIPGVGGEVLVIEELLAESASCQTPPHRDPASLALLQFTSGSSGQVRAVRLPFETLHANVAAISHWLDWSECDASAFWLPHYHDMGLIGGLITPIARQCDFWLMSPEQFIRRPLEYLRCFGELGARLSALPGFALEYMSRRITPADLSGMDFSAVKAFVVGAEPINAASLLHFQELLEPFGLPRNSLLPAYGLAEATLATCGALRGQPWVVRSASDRSPTAVGCGPPLPGMEVTIMDESGMPVTDGEIGEIVIRGTSVAAGYQTPQNSDAGTSFRRDALHTGDAGFFTDGQLFPLGRLGDSLKLRGIPVFAESIEIELNKIGFPREHTAVLLGMRNGTPIAVWIAERARTRPRELGFQILARLAEGAQIVLFEVDRNAIPRTSSGKPRRRALWTDFINGRISGELSEVVQPVL